VWRANMQVYGTDKVWKQINRERIAVARCTVVERHSSITVARINVSTRVHRVEKRFRTYVLKLKS
jgi:hypothetical protein